MDAAPAPTPPFALTANGQEIYDRLIADIIEDGRIPLRQLDAWNIAMWAEEQASYLRAQRILAETGPLLTDHARGTKDNPAHKKNPLLPVAAGHREFIFKMSTHYGFTPRSAQLLKPPPPKVESIDVVLGQPPPPDEEDER